MDLRVSSLKPGPLAQFDCLSDPEETEVSDDDDDDRNHKHRRREAHSESLERDVSVPIVSKQFKKERSKTFGNRHPFGENGFKAFETLNATTERELSSKIERRRPGLTSVPRAPLGLSQRLWANQSFTGDPGAESGTGRESGSWNQQNSRFHSIYTGRGLPDVSNDAQSASWNSFGLVQGVPNGGLDMLCPIGLQGTHRPSVNSSLNISIPRQQCRDFEERGFCLRGDMCPMEHGVNRIVIEDVQGLSQFDLPVSLPSSYLMGVPAGSGSLRAISASATSINGRDINGKVSKCGVVDDSLGYGDAYSGPSCVTGADLYDPDQPLWNDSGLKTSNAPLTLESSEFYETEPIGVGASADRHHVRLSDAPACDFPTGNTRPSVSSHSAGSSVGARHDGSRNRLDMKEKNSLSSIHYTKNKSLEDNDELVGIQEGSSQGKPVVRKDVCLKATNLSSEVHIDSLHNIRRPSQKALRTLFVNGIPQKINKREALLSHFKKFGEVIDINIPFNSERAFVQFSKREEAEAALKAPDAVMGNRFIKLQWANRDSIHDYGITSGNGVTATPLGKTSAMVPSLPVAPGRGKDINQSFASKNIIDIPPSDQPNPALTNGPKVLPPLQKKLQNLEQLKEELRKKQEMLDQKRSEFRRKLDKLEKATGLKSEAVTEQAAKRLKMDSADAAKLASPQLSDSGSGMASPHGEAVATDKNKTLVNTVSQSPKSIATMGLRESTSLKQQAWPLTPVNRYKLDNRPTTFRVIPPLPTGLANAAVLKEHFLPCGELSAIELDDVGVQDKSGQSEARITFTTRDAAERAFIYGKCWKDYNLKFMWLPSSSSSNDSSSREQSLSAPKEPLYIDDDHPEENLENCVTQEVAISGGEGPIDSESKNGLEHINSGEDLPCTPRQVSSAKQSFT